MTTMREHLLTVLDHAGDILDVEGMDTRAQIHAHTLGALAILDQAALDILKSTDAHGQPSLANAYRSVPDPKA